MPIYGLPSRRPLRRLNNLRPGYYSGHRSAYSSLFKKTLTKYRKKRLVKTCKRILRTNYHVTAIDSESPGRLELEPNRGYTLFTWYTKSQKPYVRAVPKRMAQKFYERLVKNQSIVRVKGMPVPAVAIDVEG